MPLMAYSPIDEGRMVDDPKLREIGAARGLSPAQVALAWAASRPGVVAIPEALSEKKKKKKKKKHQREGNWMRRTSSSMPRNCGASMRPPRRKSALAMI